MALRRSLPWKQVGTAFSLLVTSPRYFSATPSSMKVVHLNHAGASPSPDSVLDKVTEHLRLEQRLGGYAAAAAVQGEVDQAYQYLADLVHAESPLNIAAVESATVGWTRLFYAMAKHTAQHLEDRSSRKIILISEAEYAANVVAACQWARTQTDLTQTKWHVLVLPSEMDSAGQSTGRVDLAAFDDMLSGRYPLQDGCLNPDDIALVCVTHIPTNAGLVNPVVEIGQQLAKLNQHRAIPAWYLVDACQSVGQRVLNVKDIQCHGLVATGRKFLRGPRGTGFLYVAPEGFGMWPDHVDHAGVPILTVPDFIPRDFFVEDKLVFQPRHGARRFEFWESSVACFLGLGEAARVAMDHGFVRIEARICALANQLYERLRIRSDVHWHHAPPASGIVTFSVDGVPPHELQEQMFMGVLDHRWEVSVVPATSTPWDSASSGVPDLLRVSVSYTNTPDEIDMFCAALEKLLESRRSQGSP